MAKTGAERAREYRARHKVVKEWVLKIGRLTIKLEWWPLNTGDVPKGRPLGTTGIKKVKKTGGTVSKP